MALCSGRGQDVDRCIASWSSIILQSLERGVTNRRMVNCSSRGTLYKQIGRHQTHTRRTKRNRKKFPEPNWGITWFREGLAKRWPMKEVSYLHLPRLRYLTCTHREATTENEGRSNENEGTLVWCFSLYFLASIGNLETLLVRRPLSGD